MGQRQHEFAVFHTALGFAGIVWAGRGLAAVHLPETAESAAIMRALQRFPDARRCAPPPSPFRRLMKRIAAALEGCPQEFNEVALDMTGVPVFQRRVYEVVRAIPTGSTLSYGEVAALAGAPGAARAAGTALAQNPFAIVVPCHRVIGAGHRIGGYSGPGGVATKRRLLALDGVAFNGERRAERDITPASRRAPGNRGRQEAP